jgi:hypothetical protein
VSAIPMRVSRSSRNTYTSLSLSGSASPLGTVRRHAP